MSDSIKEQIEDEIKRYIDLRDKADSIATQMETIRMNLQQYMEGNKLDQLNAIGYGKFVLESKRTWTYSPGIEKAEEDLKALKKVEQQKGIATSTTSNYVKFTEEKIK